jgi:hypothetical protein
LATLRLRKLLLADLCLEHSRKLNHSPPSLLSLDKVKRKIMRRKTRDLRIKRRSPPFSTASWNVVRRDRFLQLVKAQISKSFPASNWASMTFDGRQESLGPEDQRNPNMVSAVKGKQLP